jgi:hypothetical protein
VSTPTYGFTTDSQPVHAHTASHMREALSVKRMATQVAKVKGFNAKVAVILTNGIGTMACAYVFTALALAGLPTALRPGGSGIVQWFAQTFLQLVLLSVIMVGQAVQSAAADARAAKTFEHTSTLVDRTDLTTEGGLKVLADKQDLALAALKQIIEHTGGKE